MAQRPHLYPGFLRDFGETRGYLLGRPSRIRVTPKGDAVVYLCSGARTAAHDLHELAVGSGQERVLLRAADALGGAEESVSPEEQARRERRRITDTGFTELQVDGACRQVLLPLAGGFVLFDRATGQVRRVLGPGEHPALDGRLSPDGSRLAFVSGGNLQVLELADAAARPRALTEGASEDRFFGLPEFVAQEEMGRHEGYWWSSDGRRLAYAEVDQSGVERFAIADPARPERQPLLFRYPRPGRDNARVGLWLSAPLEPGASGPVGAPTAVRWDDGRYPYLARVLWDAPGAPLTILVQTRDQRETALLAVDERSGATRPLVIEQDDAWVNLDPDLPRWLPGGQGLLWASERRGGRTLELRRPDGSLERELSTPADGFRELLHVASDGRSLKLLLGDAVFSRVEALDLPTGRRQPLTDGSGEHQAVFSSDGATAVIIRTAFDALPEMRVVRAAGPGPTLPSRAATPPFRARVEHLQVTGPAGDGPPTTWNAAVIRPADFQPGRRYPVVLHVYGGPHSLMVKADERAFLLDQWIADHGVIVVTLDNRGTPRRGRDWERVIKGALGDVPLADQAAGLTALGGRLPELDLGRVGIYGWSFGGYLSALAVLRRPDLFRVAVAGAPVVDWRDYDTHYTERYLGDPRQAAADYDRASLLTHAAELSRPLLLVHGTADDNVYFFHSLKLAEALLRAGRPFDFLPLARVTHQVGDPLLREQVWRRMVDYLLDRLV